MENLGEFDPLVAASYTPHPKSYTLVRSRFISVNVPR